MHPHSRSLRYLLMVLLIAALVVLFPLSARSQHELATMMLGALSV